MLEGHGRFGIRLPIWLAIAVFAVGALPVRAQDEMPRTYMSLDYQEFPTFAGAVRNSLAPTNFRANTGAVVRNTLDPLNPTRYVAAVFIVQATRQLASGQSVDLRQIAAGLSPAGLACGYLGAQAGELMGAAAQSVMANALGPIGGFVGFASRPVLWYLGSTMGQDLGAGLQRGEVSPTDAMAKALQDFNPVQDSSQMIGDSLGAVVGQALIPIPLVGALAGGVIGGSLGLVCGKAFVASPPGQALDSELRARLASLARGLAAGEDSADRPAVQATATPPPAAPARGPSGAPNAAAYKNLIEALKSGDLAKIRAAHDALRQPTVGN